MSYKATTLILTAVLLVSAAATAHARQTKAPRHIQGRVLSAQGTPVDEAEVCARPLNPIPGGFPCARSDAAGRFSIPIEVSETYYLTAKKEADGYPDSYQAFYRVPFLHLPEVVVADGQPPPEVTLQLGFQAARLKGSITDAETNRPVKEASLRLCRLEPPRYCSKFYPLTVEGGYSLLAPPAPLAMEVSAPGYEDWAAPGHLQITPGSEMELDVALRRAQPGSPRAAALPAPRQTAPAEGAVFEHYPRTTVLEWAAVPGAASYTVEVEYFYPCAGADCPKTAPHQLNGDPPQFGLEATRYEFNFAGAQRGRWRVRAVDAQGRAGAKSPWSSFRYKN
jgi:hypothetical protein